MGSLCLFAFPFSPFLWFAVGLLWILDVGNNMAMEPYRAFVGDKLPEKQLSLGYQMQSLFVGAGILLANASIFLFQDLSIFLSDMDFVPIQGRDARLGALGCGYNPSLRGRSA